MVGKTLGHYEILAPLGMGGMGEVYRARDTTLDRDVAIKVLPADFTKDQHRLARFEREAKLLASLNHANIAAIYGLEEADDVRFIVMECVEGETLAERIDRDGAIKVDEALEVARQIAAALEAAQEKGIVHRDLKPANIKLTPDGDVKVLDFGLAKAYDGDGSSATVSPDLSHSPTTAAATRNGVILGTASYMSPEQARGKRVDKRTDTWAFGCVLYEMLAGKQAFHGETASDTMAAILTVEPDRRALPTATPRAIMLLLERCLRKDPRRRLRDVGDAWLEIEDTLASASGARADTAALTRAGERVGPTEALPGIPHPSLTRRGSRARLLGVLAVGVAIGLGLMWLLLQGNLATAPSRSSMPSHPRELEILPLPFDPPSAADYRHELAGGAVAYVAENHDFPLVDIEVLIRTGSYLERPEEEGVAGLVGSQLSRGGAGSMAARQFDEEIELLAAELDSEIGTTSGALHLNFLSKDLDRAVAMLFDVLRRPRFQQEPLELAKDQLLQGFRNRKLRPRDIESREWSCLQRGPDHVASRALMVPAAAVGALDRRRLLDFHERTFHPAALVFAISGDLDTDAILAMLDGHLRDWRPGGDGGTESPATDFEPRPGLYLVDVGDAEQGRISMGHRAPGNDVADHHALLVVDEILGRSFGSRLWQRLRAERGLVGAVSSDIALGDGDLGTFQIRFQTRNEQVAQATALTLEEIKRLRAEPVSDSELELAKSKVLSRFVERFSSDRSTVRLFASDELAGRDPGFWQTFGERVSGVTDEDVRRAANDHLQPHRLVILAIGNVRQMLAGDPENPLFSLSALAPQAVVERILLPDPLTMVRPRGS